MQDIIFISLEYWDTIWRRNKFLCAEIARRFPERKILFVEPATDFSRAMRKGDWQRLSPRRFSLGSSLSVEGYPNIFRIRPRKFLPSSWAPGRMFNEWLARAEIKSAAASLGIESPLLWINPYSGRHFAGQLGETRVVYDITDDWEKSSNPEWLQSFIRERDRELCQRADLVIVCSENLYESRKQVARDIFLLPNGVNPAHYARAGETVPAADRKWKAPVFGYTGSLHSDRLDLDLLLSVARDLPHASFVLVGPSHLDAHERERLKAASNIFLVKEQPYSSLPEIMSHFDTLIVPHVVSPFTESLNPIKLWEYLATAKPIVSTAVAGFRDYPTLCRITRSAEEFSEACSDSLSERDPVLREARKAEAQKNNWSSRADQLLARLETLKPRE